MHLASKVVECTLPRVLPPPLGFARLLWNRGPGLHILVRFGVYVSLSYALAPYPSRNCQKALASTSHIREEPDWIPQYTYSYNMREIQHSRTSSYFLTQKEVRDCLAAVRAQRSHYGTHRVTVLPGFQTLMHSLISRANNS